MHRTPARRRWVAALFLGAILAAVEVAEHLLAELRGFGLVRSVIA